jgi:hypothetical protein
VKSEEGKVKGVRTMRLWITGLSVALLFCSLSFSWQAKTEPTSTTSLVVKPAAKEAQVFGRIYPTRFNAARGDEAHYHLLVWQGGTSAHALIETPADDLAFHDALSTLGAQPGDNLTMASWNERKNRESRAPLEKVLGDRIEVRISWKENPAGLPVAQVFDQSPIPSPPPPVEWRFGGNRDRWFNHLPLAPRPGCLACLYSCPSGKVSNGALNIRDYVITPSRFMANTAILPPDGTGVIVTFRVAP